MADILFVDHQAETTSEAADRLGANGHRVLHVSPGADGYPAMEGRRFDVIVLDARAYPETLEPVIRRLLREPDASSVVAVVDASSRLGRVALRAGATDVLSVDRIDPERLVGRLEAILADRSPAEASGPISRPSDALQSQKMDAVGTLAGGLAHNFNNLLTGVLGSAALVRERPHVDASVSELIDIIERAALRGRDLCSQLLRISRRRQPNVAPLDVHEVILEVMAIAERTFPKNLDVRIASAAGALTFLGDRTEANQALMNLVTNARDAMPHGGHLDVRVSTSPGVPGDLLSPPVADGVEYICVEVLDTGDGISEAVQTRMFDPFFTTKKSGKGSGLGLATVFSIARSHGGHVRSWSTTGLGSKFALFLPSAGAVPVLDGYDPQEAIVERRVPNRSLVS